MENDLIYYKRLTEFLGKSLGSMYSTALFEYNGGEFISAAAYNIDAEAIARTADFLSEELNEEDEVLNKAIEAELGQISKISAYVMRDGSGNAVGVLCILMKCTQFFKINNWINEFLKFHGNGNEDDIKNYPLTLEGISEYIKDYNIQKSKPSKGEREEIICDLYDMGMFNIKGAVMHTADELKMSAKSVYRYISEIKNARS